MAKKNVTARVDELQLKRAGRYLKTHWLAATVRAALDFVAEKAAHDEVVRLQPVFRISFSSMSLIRVW
jgi:hypothetical protein